MDSINIINKTHMAVRRALLTYISLVYLLGAHFLFCAVRDSSLVSREAPSFEGFQPLINGFGSCKCKVK